MREIIEKKLRARFSPEHLNVIDESEQHRGHAGYRAGGNTHFRIQMQAKSLSGLNRVQAQRLIYKELQAEFDAGLHALAMELS